LQQSFFEEASPQRQICWLPLDQIEPRDDIAYLSAQGESLSELAASIRRFGLLEPITVAKTAATRYEIIAGNRRFYACRMAGFSHIDAIIMPSAIHSASLSALFQSLLTGQPHFLEEARAIAQLLTACPITREELARRLNKSVSHITNKLQLTKLEPAVQCLILDYHLSESHARALLRLPDLKNRLQIAQKAYDESLSARDTDLFIDSVLRRLPVPPPPGRRIISLMRDHRIYLNAIRGIVEQMTESGIGAQMETVQDGTDIQIRITLQKSK